MRAALTPERRRFIWRLVLVAALFFALGYFSRPVVSPLMCKVYG